MYTHCPNCNTHFAITQEYLDIANGKVRCGKCDHVFNALENLYNHDEQVESLQLESAISITEQQPASTIDKRTDTDTASSTAETFKKADSQQDSGSEALVTPPLASIDIKEKMERIAASLSAATQELKNARKSVGFKRQKSETDGTTRFKTRAESEPRTDQAEKLDTETISTAKTDDLDIAATEHSQIQDDFEPAELATDSSPVEVPALVDELELMDFSELQEEDEHAISTGHDATPVDESDLDILNSLIGNREHEAITSDSLLEELNDINNSLSREGLSLDDELDDGNDIFAELEQLEKEYQPSETDTATEAGETYNKRDNDYADIYEDNAEQPLPEAGKQSSTTPAVEEEVVPPFLTQDSNKSASATTLFGWLFATIIMLLLLAAQYLHFNSVKLADNPAYRPFLETLCPITGCILPLRKAPDKIITINHDVHTHPSVKNALEIQLSFRNKADFIQQYPLLEVIFSNPRGEIIARRTFTPNEYLKRHSSYLAGIKPNQTEKINLEIVDPDPGALLGFQFNYL